MLLGNTSSLSSSSQTAAQTARRGVGEEATQERITATGSQPASRPVVLERLTGLRIFGALAVVAVHVGPSFVIAPVFTTAEEYGYVGVTFFYLLSGLVLTWAWRPQPVIGFWLTRLIRIWPLQVALALVSFTVLAASEQVPRLGGRLADLFLLQAWSPNPHVYYGGNGVSWSLSCEIFFYAAFPFLVVPLRRLHARGLAVVGAATLLMLGAAPALATALGVSTATYNWLFFIFPPYRLGEFVLGMVLGRALVLGVRCRLPRLSATLGLLGLGALGWVFTHFTVQTGTFVPRPYVALAIIPLLALLLLAAASADLAAVPSWLRSGPLVRLGRWSFALYLVHKPLFLLTSGWGWWSGFNGPMAAVGLLAFVVMALAAAAVVHAFVEGPMDRSLRVLVARRSGVIASEGSREVESPQAPARRRRAAGDERSGDEQRRFHARGGRTGAQTAARYS